MEKKSIGQFISVLRKANGMTQKQLAEKLNVSDKSVSRWERDECMPDLTLIPVLAEIFGVTSDEILKGERIDFDKKQDNKNKQTEKQLDNILESLKTKFLIKNLIVMGIVVVGLFLSIVLGIIVKNTYVALCSSFSFSIASLVLEFAFIKLHFSAIKNDEFDDKKLNSCRKYFVNISKVSFSIIFLIMFNSLGFVTEYSTAIMYSEARIEDGILQYIFNSSEIGIPAVIGVISIIICVFANLIATNIILKKGVYIEAENIKRKATLKLKSVFIVFGIMLFTFVCQNTLNEASTFLVKGTVYTDFDKLKEFVETAYDTDNNIISPDEDGIYRFKDNDINESEFDFDYVNNEDIVIRNQNIAYIYTDYGEDFPVTVVLKQDVKKIKNIFIFINIGFVLIYLVEILTGIYIYLKKRAKLPGFSLKIS